MDSTFCKRCGTVIEDADIQEATVKLNALIADGNRIFADGRTEEAMMIAESAVLSHPSCPAALSLKGMCHERMGQVSEALECFERVVEINPDSTLDRIKANDLRNLIVMRNYAHQPQQSSRLPLLAAAAAAALVIAVGAFAAKANARPQSDIKNLVAQNDANQNMLGFGTKLSSGAQATANPAGANAGMPGGTPGIINQGPTNPVGQQPQQQQQPTLGIYKGGNQLPGVDGNGGMVDPNLQGGIGKPTIKPYDPGKPPTGTDTPPTGQNKTVEDPVLPDQHGSDSTVVEQPKEDPGIIEITPAKASTPSLGGGRDALIHSARGLFQQGNFDGAARSYERALRSGADQASTNQRLGQCYQNLGRTSDAIAAYERAASAYEAQIASGRGDSGRLSSALEACRQAIKVLRGN